MAAKHLGALGIMVKTASLSQYIQLCFLMGNSNPLAELTAYFLSWILDSLVVQTREMYVLWK